MPNDSKLRILGKKVIMEKSQNCGGNSLVSPPKTIFGSSTQKLCKSRHLSFLVLLVLSNYTSFFLIFPKIFSKLETSEHKLNFNDFSNYSYKLKKYIHCHYFVPFWVHRFFIYFCFPWWFSINNNFCIVVSFPS